MDKIPDSKNTVTVYELGSEKHDGNQYPAVSINAADDYFLTAIGAKLSFGTAFRYGNSVKSGVSELQSYLTKRSLDCPSTQLILGGYSQGAQVAGQALASIPKSIRDKIIFVSLYGDPKLSLPEAQSMSPRDYINCGKFDYTHFSPWRRVTGDCYTRSGQLGARLSYVPSDMKNRVGAWCNKNDMICDNRTLKMTGHSEYTTPQTSPIDLSVAEAVSKLSKKVTFKNAPNTAQKIEISYLKDGRCSVGGGYSIQNKMFPFENVIYKSVASERTRLSFGNQYAWIDDSGHDVYYRFTENDIQAGLKRISRETNETTRQIIIGSYNCYDESIDGPNPPGIGTTPDYTDMNTLEIGNSIGDPYKKVVSRQLLHIHYNDANGGDLIDYADTLLKPFPMYAIFPTYQYKVPAYEPITLSVSNSHGFNNDTIAQYQWDFNEDSVIDEITTSPTIEYIFEKPGSTTVKVRAVSENGGVDVNKVSVKVGDPYITSPAAKHATLDSKAPNTSSASDAPPQLSYKK